MRIVPILISPFVGLIIAVYVSRFFDYSEELIQHQIFDERFYRYDNITMFNFWYLIIVLVSVAVPFLAVFAESESVELWVACIFGWWLIYISVVDMKSMRITLFSTINLAISGLIWNVFICGGIYLDYVIGSIVGYVTFRVISIVYYLARGREGLGGGDANLLGAAGAWIGWSGLPSIVFAASMIALFFLSFGRGYLYREYGGNKIPFGPFICLALWGYYLNINFFEVQF